MVLPYWFFAFLYLLCLVNDGKVELSRREREEIEKQKAKERYQKLHAEGKTDQAKADLARLAAIREKREQEAIKRREENKAKEEESKKKLQQSSRKVDSAGPSKKWRNKLLVDFLCFQLPSRALPNPFA